MDFHIGANLYLAMYFRDTNFFEHNVSLSATVRMLRETLGEILLKMSYRFEALLANLRLQSL